MVSFMKNSCLIRPIEERDNSAIADIIRQVSEEYGLTAANGYAVGDASVDNMFQAYNRPGACYWVVEKDEVVIGGGGLAPLQGEESVAELQKMYLLPSARGLGVGHQLATQALEFARRQGFRQCYLETTESLKGAIALYHKMGFETLSAPMGCTGHGVCEVRMLKQLL